MADYLISIFDNYAEVDSLLEVKTSCEPDQWLQVINETIEKYVHYLVVKKLDPKTVLDKNDKRIFRQLKRSYETFKKLSPMEMLKFDIDKMVEDRSAFIKNHFEQAHKKLVEEKAKDYIKPISSL